MKLPTVNFEDDLYFARRYENIYLKPVPCLMTVEYNQRKSIMEDIINDEK